MSIELETPSGCALAPDVAERAEAFALTARQTHGDGLWTVEVEARLEAEWQTTGSVEPWSAVRSVARAAWDSVRETAVASWDAESAPVTPRTSPDYAETKEPKTW